MPVRRESLTELHNRGRLAVVMVGKQIFDGDRRSEGLSEGAAALFSVTPRCVPKRSRWWLYACIFGTVCALTDPFGGRTATNHNGGDFARYPCFLLWFLGLAWRLLFSLVHFSLPQ